MLTASTVTKALVSAGHTYGPTALKVAGMILPIAIDAITKKEQEQLLQKKVDEAVKAALENVKTATV